MKNLKRFAILTHRYLGVCFSVLFLLWFASGVVMMYHGYPGVVDEDRLARLEPLDPALVRVPPAAAYARSGLTTQPLKTRLTMTEGRPVYRFHGPARAQYPVYADTGEPIAQFPLETARAAAARYAQLPAAQARFLGRLEQEDQWTLNKVIRPLKPMLHFAFDDANQTEVYVSQRTGEVMQLTTRSSRFWGFCGAVVHWIYLTPIRKQTEFWRALVTSLSAIGTLMTLAGIVAGIWLYSPSKRYKIRGSGPSSIPYAGMKRWHTILGLAFGLVTFTWILSGMFSMNPLLWSPEGDPDGAARKALAGGPVQFEKIGPVSLDPGVKEVEFVWFQGAPWMLRKRGARQTELVNANGVRLPHLDRAVLEATAPKLNPAPVTEAAWLTEYDAYYYDRNQRKPLPVLRVKYADAANTWHYIDASSATLAASYVDRSRLERWIYHGLHSLDFPFLYKHRPAWDITVLTLMSGGILLCVTSLWIAGKRARVWWNAARAPQARRRPGYSDSHEPRPSLSDRPLPGFRRTHPGTPR